MAGELILQSEETPMNRCTADHDDAPSCVDDDIFLAYTMIAPQTPEEAQGRLMKGLRERSPKVWGLVYDFFALHGDCMDVEEHDDGEHTRHYSMVPRFEVFERFPRIVSSYVRDHGRDVFAGGDRSFADLVRFAEGTAGNIYWARNSALTSEQEFKCSGMEVGYARLSELMKERRRKLPAEFPH